MTVVEIDIDKGRVVLEGIPNPAQGAYYKGTFVEGGEFRQIPTKLVAVRYSRRRREW